MKSTPHKKRRQKQSLLGKARWAGYAAAGAATVLGTHEVAEADIHYSGPVNVFLNASLLPYPQQRSDTYNMDVNGDGLFDLQMVHFGSIYQGKDFGVALAIGQVAGKVAGNPAYSYAYNLAKDDPIPGAMPFHAIGTMAAGYGYTNSEFKNTDGYIGFKFNSAEGTHHGWVQIDIEALPWNAFTVVDYAYADAGESILAGKVPEPGSLGLLATGAIGLLLWRRKRSQKDAA